MMFVAQGRQVRNVGLSEWERAWPWLAKSLPYMQGRASQTELRGRIMQGSSQLWMVEEQFTGTELGAIFTTVTGDTMMVEMIGGEGLLQLLDDFLPKIEDYMKQTYGCTKSMLVGRLGWQRSLKRLGYKPQLVLCERDLTVQ